MRKFALWTAIGAILASPVLFASNANAAGGQRGFSRQDSAGSYHTQRFGSGSVYDQTKVGVQPIAVKKKKRH